jgi:hypothetical protein
MLMDAMRMNQGNVSQCSIIEEDLNADAARFFDLLKDSDEPLWDGCTNQGKLSAIAQVFTIKSDHGLRYQKIDMCPNFCMLYYLENVELTECKTCGHSRYKPRTGREKTLVAYKKLRYFPITPRL